MTKKLFYAFLKKCVITWKYSKIKNRIVILNSLLQTFYLAKFWFSQVKGQNALSQIVGFVKV